MIFLSLIQLTYYYKKDSLICLGNFGITYFIANIFIKNISICLMIATVSSYILFNCEKNFEGFNPIAGCGENITPTYLESKNLEQVKKEKEYCVTEERVHKSKRAEEGDPDKQKLLDEKIKEIRERKNYCEKMIKRKEKSKN